MASLSAPAIKCLDRMSSELIGRMLFGIELTTSIPLASTSLVSHGVMADSRVTLVEVTFVASQCHKEPSLEQVNRWLGWRGWKWTSHTV